MFDKIKDYIPKLTKTIKKKLNGISQPIKWVIISYFLLVVVLVLTYFAAWMYLFTVSKSTLNDLLLLINAMIGTSMVAFITFIAGCFVDLDKDGIPDRFEFDDRKDGFK